MRLFDGKSWRKKRQKKTSSKHEKLTERYWNSLYVLDVDTWWKKRSHNPNLHNRKKNLMISICGEAQDHPILINGKVDSCIYMWIQFHFGLDSRRSRRRENISHASCAFKWTRLHLFYWNKAVMNVEMLFSFLFLAFLHRFLLL